MSFRFNQGDRPLPGYTIQRGVGRGGFGEVYYATSDGGKEVALKYLRENPQVELRGAQHCLNLKSPHLVAIHDIKQNAEGDFFVVMEYVGGVSLRDLMNEEPAGLGMQKAAYFLREIGRGLSYLHERGIVHRDLKPGNIFYEDGYVKIGDYGLSKLMAASHHSGQTVSVGTVHYMAPEVGSGNYDKTIDIYALGVILYEMLLGRVPFAGASMGEVLMKHLTVQPEVDELPQPFPNVIRKALAKDPRDRYQSVDAMMADVFALEHMERSVASFDSLALTRMAAVAAKKVKIGAASPVGAAAPAGAAAAIGAGSSNVPHFGAPPVLPPLQRGGRGGSSPAQIDPTGRRQTPIREQLQPLWTDFKERPFGLTDAQQFPQRSRINAGLLGLFLGEFGIHRFYTGFYRIGVIQLILSIVTGGVAGLWGIIEGIYILSGGDYRDSLGRPLEESQRKYRDPAARSVVARAMYAIIGALFAITACVFLIVATVAPAEYEFYRTPDNERVFFNMFHWMYFAACFAVAIAGFCIWKSAHRGGLPFWRVTIRPALMAFCVAMTSGAVVLYAFIAAYPFQLPLLILAGVFALAFLALWILRGNGLVLRPGDLYWNNALKSAFVLLGLACAAAGAFSLRAWKDDRYRFDRGVEPYRTIQLTQDERGRFEVGYRRQVTLPVPVYNAEPILLGAAAILFIGSGVEAQYRRQLAARARDSLAGSA